MKKQVCDVLILSPNTTKKLVNDSNNENDGNDGGKNVFNNRIQRLYKYITLLPSPL